MLVGQQLERGLAPLRALPGAVAAEVVDEMRVAALQRGPAPGFDTSGGGDFPAPQQGALLLGDGAGRAWQVCCRLRGSLRRRREKAVHLAPLARRRRISSLSARVGPQQGAQRRGRPQGSSSPLHEAAAPRRGSSR